MKRRVLFLCVHNSARSQIAEAWLNHLCGDQFEAHSAGLEPGPMNPFVVQAMAEVGIDISDKQAKWVFDVFKSGLAFAYVIGVCDRSKMEKCPIFPSSSLRLDWSFPDPSEFRGTDEQILQRVRQLRDEIRTRIAEWCEVTCEKI